MSGEVTDGTGINRGAGLNAASLALDEGVIATPTIKLGSSFLLGTVVVCEPRALDYRFWGEARNGMVNQYGASTLKAALKLVANVAVAPKLLVLPAGTFWSRLPVQGVEERAAALVVDIVANLKSELRRAKQKGLVSIVLGVDASNNGCQVPVHIDLTGPRMRVVGLARRSDGDPSEKFAPSAMAGTRTIILDGTAIYVAYCGEIGKTGKHGTISSLMLGKAQSHAAVVDLAHYFRWPSAPKGSSEQNKSGLSYFLRACANAASPQRLNAPVFVSVALVDRQPYTGADSDSAQSYWLAVNRRRRDDLLAGPSYRQPDEVVAMYPAGASSGSECSPLLTVNLFA